MALEKNANSMLSPIANSHLITKITFVFLLCLFFTLLIVLGSSGSTRYYQDQMAAVYGHLRSEGFVFFCGTFITTLFAVILCYASLMVIFVVVGRKERQVAFSFACLTAALCTALLVYFCIQRFVFSATVTVLALLSVILNTFSNFKFKLDALEHVDLACFRAVLRNSFCFCTGMGMISWGLMSIWYFFVSWPFLFRGQSKLRCFVCILHMLFWSFTCLLWVQFNRTVLCRFFFYKQYINYNGLAWLWRISIWHSIRNTLGYCIISVLRYPYEYWRDLCTRAGKSHVTRIRLWRLVVHSLPHEQRQIFKSMSKYTFDRHYSWYSGLDIVVENIRIISILSGLALLRVLYPSKHLPYFVTLWMFLYWTFFLNIIVHLVVDSVRMFLLTKDVAKDIEKECQKEDCL